MMTFGEITDPNSGWVDEFRAAVNIDGVRSAESVVRDAGILPTLLMQYPLLTEAVGCELYLKHENHLPTGAFKVRGGLNYMKHFAERELAAGVITATRGNHGQSIGLAAKRYGIPCVVCVPQGNNPEKNCAMRAGGVELIECGNDYDDARIECERLRVERNLHYVHGANEPLLINGVGTYWLEVLQQLPDVDTVVVPIGGGSGACGAIAVFRALKPDVQIIGVQAETAPAVRMSWESRSIVETETADTIADGVATRTAFDLPLAIMRDGIDDIVTVTEDQIAAALRLILRTAHTLVEGASACTVAAIVNEPERFAGRRVVAAMTGANIDRATLRGVLN